MMSQESPRRSTEEAGFDQGTGCASSRQTSSPPEARAGKDDETFNRCFIKGSRGPDKIDKGWRLE
jgi:hypothetical protein